MPNSFAFSEFVKRFPDDETCLEEVKKVRFRNGIFCDACGRITSHYKLKKRMAYSCEFCRDQVYPLSGTIFHKSTTPLRLWFFALFLMTQTRGSIAIAKLQKELGVTYKTAWRMHFQLRKLMKQSEGELFISAADMDEEYKIKPEKSWVQKWVFFNKLEIKVVEKEGKSG